MFIFLTVFFLMNFFQTRKTKAWFKSKNETQMNFDKANLHCVEQYQKVPM